MVQVEGDRVSDGNRLPGGICYFVEINVFTGLGS